MSSLFDNTALPLWAWIVIITVSSLILISSFALFVRWIVARKRESGFVEAFGDGDLPQRRVTVRRGRVVPSANYLSLTGSKFGLNAFDAEFNDARSGARSKSPFEWWATLKDRSASRHSYVTQYTGDGSSVFGMPTSPQPQSRIGIYQRPDFERSTTSLSVDLKDDEGATTATVVEVEPEPSPPRRTPNFSRSFSQQGHYTDFATRHQHKLSRIEESSPHTSMISTRQSRALSVASKHDNLSHSSASPLPRISIGSNGDFSLPPGIATGSAPNSKKSSIYREAQQNGSTASLTMPRPVAYNSAKSTLREMESARRPTYPTITPANIDVERANRIRSQTLSVFPSQSEPEKESPYWEVPQEPTPSRSNSKKGRVLRKKSLSRTEAGSRPDTR